MSDDAVKAVIVQQLSSTQDKITVQIYQFIIIIISKICYFKFALHCSTALLTTLSLYALSGWFSTTAPTPIAECMYEMEICCPVTVRLLCTWRLSRLFLRMCNRGFQDLLSVRPSSLFMLNGCISYFNGLPDETIHVSGLGVKKFSVLQYDGVILVETMFCRCGFVWLCQSYPKDYTQYSKHGESLKSRTNISISICRMSDKQADRKGGPRRQYHEVDPIRKVQQ